MPVTPTSLLDDHSLEITGKDAHPFLAAPPVLTSGTKVNVTFLGNEDLHQRRIAAQAVSSSGYTAVPHISARRLRSRQELEDFLLALQTDGTVQKIFTIAGDPVEPLGPYPDALTMIESAPLEDFGVQSVGITGYPEGHPQISDEQLWTALERKASVLDARGLSGDIITQFGFDVDPVMSWIEQVRDHGIELPIRVGVPGPAGVKRLLGYAKRFGVSSSAGIAKKYGLSLTNLLGTTGPDKLVQELAHKIDPARHGSVKLHFYTFGGVHATADWIHHFTGAALTKDLDVTH